jgi:hypothetical protein
LAAWPRQRHGPTTRRRGGEAERRKALFSYLRQGIAVLVWDNILRGSHITSPTIEKALTSPEVSDRVLQESGSETASAATVQIFNGNNIGPEGDMTNRSFRITINVDRPDPVAAGVVGAARMRAVLAVLDMSAESRGSAALDGRHDLQLPEVDPSGGGGAPGRAPRLRRGSLSGGRYPPPRSPVVTKASRDQAGGLTSVSSRSSGLVTSPIALMATRVWSAVMSSFLWPSSTPASAAAGSG